MSEGKKGSCPLGSISKPGWHHQESKAGSGPMAIPNGQEQQIRTAILEVSNIFFATKGVCYWIPNLYLNLLGVGWAI